MNELIKVTEENGNQVVNARDLYGFLESKQEFSNWIKKRISEYEFVENQDFISFDKIIKREIGATKIKEYAISLNMAKELSMVERNEQGRKARRYFIKMEQLAMKKLKSLSRLQKTNKNAISAKRLELINEIRNYLRWGDMNKASKKLGVQISYVKKVLVNAEFNTEQADKVTEFLYKIALNNKNELLFGYQQMINMLQK